MSYSGLPTRDDRSFSSRLMIRVSGDIDGTLDISQGISAPDGDALVWTAAAQVLHSTALNGHGSQQQVITANASMPLIVRWPFDALREKAKALVAQCHDAVNSFSSSASRPGLAMVYQAVVDEVDVKDFVWVAFQHMVLATLDILLSDIDVRSCRLSAGQVQRGPDRVLY